MPDPARADPARRVVLHVGTPKSGTTFVQQQMHANRRALRRAGYLYPGQRPSHFLHAMDLREKGFHGHVYEDMDGAWARLCAEIAEFDGPALVSHEMMGGLHDRGLERAATSFPGRDVRVVVTCRDLGRQLPALWQERVKNGARMPYERYLARAEKGWTGLSSSGMPWAGQNLAAIGRRWGEIVGPENVVFVTVPHSGAAPDELWRRFAEATGLSDIGVTLVESGANASMGTAEVELLRRINKRLPRDLPWPDHSRLIKKRFAQKRLAGQRAAGALTVPEHRRGAVEKISEEMLEALAGGGHRVVGDLAELRPSFRDGTTPASLGEAAIADVATDQLVALLLAGRRGGGRGRRARHPAAGSGAGARTRRTANRVARRLRGGSTG